MTFRPAWKIFPSAKLAADNAGELELTTHCRAVASAAAALTISELPRDSSPLPHYPSLPPSSSPPLTDTDDATLGATTNSLQVQQHQKRPFQAISNSPPPISRMPSSDSRHSAIILSPTTSDADTAPTAKRVKAPVASPSRAALTENSIIKIDDIDDPRDKQLNRSNAIADIAFFFELIPVANDQEKHRARCTTCR
jgi:hypothetical protein